jgi:hypothetical protein
VTLALGGRSLAFLAGGVQWWSAWFGVRDQAVIASHPLRTLAEPWETWCGQRMRYRLGARI